MKSGELAVEVRELAGNTAVGSLRLRCGGEHCHRELAGEAEEKKEKEKAGELTQNLTTLT